MVVAAPPANEPLAFEIVNQVAVLMTCQFSIIGPEFVSVKI